jgi:hypothetical protein
MTIRCDGCGKFVSYSSIEQGKAVYHFIPDSDLSTEEVYLFCSKCQEEDRAKVWVKRIISTDVLEEDQDEDMYQM